MENYGREFDPQSQIRSNSCSALDTEKYFSPNHIPTPQVDDSQPTTSLQIRLADGTRLQCRFNLYHTIDDIRGFINRWNAFWLSGFHVIPLPHTILCSTSRKPANPWFFSKLRNT